MEKSPPGTAFDSFERWLGQGFDERRSQHRESESRQGEHEAVEPIRLDNLGTASALTNGKNQTLHSIVDRTSSDDHPIKTAAARSAVRLFERLQDRIVAATVPEHDHRMLSD